MKRYRLSAKSTTKLVIATWLSAVASEQVRAQTDIPASASTESAEKTSAGIQSADAVKDAQAALQEMIRKLDNPATKVPTTAVGPYATPAADDGRYGHQPEAVIAAGLSDLDAGNYETFMRKMFPSAMIMKTDGRWTAMVRTLQPESPLIRKMIADLNAMTLVEPEIVGDTATYLLPNEIVQPGRQAVRNGARVLEDIIH